MRLVGRLWLALLPESRSLAESGILSRLVNRWSLAVRCLLILGLLVALLLATGLLVLAAVAGSRLLVRTVGLSTRFEVVGLTGPPALVSPHLLLLTDPYLSLVPVRITLSSVVP